MKNNTSTTKSYLTEALRSIPPDFALGNAKQYISAALREIEIVEKKRGKREAGIQQQNLQINQQAINRQNAPSIVSGLDAMIQEEQEKLEALRKKPEPPENKFLTD